MIYKTLTPSLQVTFLCFHNYAFNKISDFLCFHTSRCSFMDVLMRAEIPFVLQITRICLPPSALGQKLPLQ
jgi:hypothetical protein